MVYSPLASGILTGRYTRDTAPPPGSRIDRMRNSPMQVARTVAGEFLTERNLRIAEAVAKAAAELGTTPAVVALAWVRARPGVTSVIIGPRSLEHLEGNLAAFDLELPPEVTARLDEVSWSPELVPVNGMQAPHEPRPTAA
jgi:aryl-alcohol dehydrogenase-like predicted oxidoreductase